MKDAVGGQVEVSRQELHDEYVNWYLHQCPDVRPCRDAYLLKKAAQYLQKEPEPRGTFTVFPLYQALSMGSRALSTDCRKLLSAVIRAIDMLETICVNLFLQPWKKEIKTIKTFTGPFVYRLLPVLSRSTVQSVLASIGYVPHTDSPPSEYRLSEDANPDRAILVGLELLLARVECYHLLELLDKNQLGPQEWQEVLQRRQGLTKPEEPAERKMRTEQKEEEKEEDADRKEAPPYLNTGPAVQPQAKPRRYHLPTTDQSIIEMQMTYSDLTFRGRPLLPDKPHRANISRTNAVHHANSKGADSKAAKLLRRDFSKDIKAAASAVSSRNESKASEVSGDADRDGGRSSAPGDAVGSSDGDAVDGELSIPQTISLHLTLRSGSTAGQKLQPAEPPAGTQQQTAADQQSETPTSPGQEEEQEQQELRELAEKLDQLHVNETKEELKRKGVNNRGESTRKERRRKVRKAEEQNLMRSSVLETGPGLKHPTSWSSQSEPAVMEEQLPALNISTADCQGSKGGSTGQRGGEEAGTGRGEEEQLAGSYVIVEHYKK